MLCCCEHCGNSLIRSHSTVTSFAQNDVFSLNSPFALNFKLAMPCCFFRHIKKKNKDSP